MKKIALILTFLVGLLILYFYFAFENTEEQKRNRINIKKIQIGMFYGSVFKIMGIPKDTFLNNYKDIVLVYRSESGCSDDYSITISNKDSLVIFIDYGY